MSEGSSAFLNGLKRLIGRPVAAYALAKAAAAHRRVEGEFRRRLQGVRPRGQVLEFPHTGLAPDDYLQRNFFSILFLSIFDAVGIRPQRAHKYGLILHAVRGIVTATDNMLDGHDKGAVRLRIAGGPILPNVLLILLQQSLVDEVISELTSDPAERRRCRNALMAALFAIAEEECPEELPVEEVLPPARLLDQVHSLRGGRLLELAFVVPEANESH
ncbi:MAG: hypothetical protein ACYS8L_08655, partial [Planctomycetota bacterium]